MGKLKLDEAAVEAVKDSIAHWKRDIQAKLKAGIKIKGTWEYRKGLIWEDDKTSVLCCGDDCRLCRIYQTRDCPACPYRLKYGMSCSSLHWRQFIKNPCLETCNGMIKALENILK